MLSVFILLRHGGERKYHVVTSRALNDMVVTVIYECAVASSVTRASLRYIIDIFSAS